MLSKYEIKKIEVEKNFWCYGFYPSVATIVAKSEFVKKCECQRTIYSNYTLQNDTF